MKHLLLPLFIAVFWFNAFCPGHVHAMPSHGMDHSGFVLCEEPEARSDSCCLIHHGQMDSSSAPIFIQKEFSFFNFSPSDFPEFNFPRFEIPIHNTSPPELIGIVVKRE